MIRILHAADLHLDSPFQAMGRDLAARRRAEQRVLLEQIAALAGERKADMVLVAGDVFDTETAYAETRQMLEQTLAAIPAPVFIAPGNHDWYGPGSPWVRLRLGKGVHVFDSERPVCVPLPELGVRVWGAAFTGRYRKAPLAGFEAAKDGDTLDVMVLHGDVGDPDSPYGPISVEDIARSGMDYIALGHRHACSGLLRAGETYYAWPGCPEGRGFDETGRKGVLLIELERDGCRAEFIPLAGRRYEILSVDLTDCEDEQEAVLSALDGDTSEDIYRIILRGETDQAPDRQTLARALEGRFFALELRDETILRRDIWASRDEDSLRGIFLAGLWEKYEAARGDEKTRDIIRRAARYGLRALENGDEAPLY